MAFDIASVLRSSSVSESDTGKEQIVYLDIDLLDPDPENFYSLDGLNDLAANIELVGLQQPIRVRPGEDGHFFIVSGHRRRAAILLIRDGDPDAFRDGVPCIVEYGEASAAMRELRLIYANSATRAMTSWEISKQAERVQDLLYQLQEEGIVFPGRMRDHVAEACKVSRTKIARLHAIRNNLDPALLAYFDKGELAEETAYQLQRLPKDIQAEAGELLASGKQKRLPNAACVEKVNKHLDGYLAELPCRSHAGGPDCHHKTGKILKSIFEQYDWNLCNPGQCCRDCYHSRDCSRACQECKDRRKLDKAVENEKETERKKAEEAKQAAYKKARQKEARRVMQLIDKMQLPEDTDLPALTNWTSLQKGPKVEAMRRMADGDFGTGHFYDSNLLPTSVEALGRWADFLGCSLDYLAGRTKEPNPAAPAAEPGWSTGTPAETGNYVILCGVPTEKIAGAFIETIQCWNGEAWTDGRGVPLRLNVYGWIRLPAA